MNSALKHFFYQLRNNICAHTVVQTSTSKNNFWVVTYSLRLVCQIIRINTDAMTTNKPWTKREKIPLSSRSLEYRFCINTHLIKNNCQLINESNIKIPLRIFNNLSSLSDFNTTRSMSTRNNYLIIKRINKKTNFRCRSRGNLHNSRNTMLFITGIDSLRAVTCKKIDIKL